MPTAQSSIQGIVPELTLTNRVTPVPIKGSVIPPQVKAVLAGAGLVIYDSSIHKFELDYCMVQNVGTVPLLYAINTVAGAEGYHGVLAAGVATEDGLGSVLSLDKVHIEKLTLWNQTATDGKISQLKLENTSRPNRS